MRLFEDVQKVAGAGRLEISVPASKALIISNLTKDEAIIFASSTAKVGYPIPSKGSLEIEVVPEQGEFWVELKDQALQGEEGLYMISRIDFEFQNTKKVYNTTVINNP